MQVFTPCSYSLNTQSQYNLSSSFEKKMYNLSYLQPNRVIFPGLTVSNYNYFKEELVSTSASSLLLVFNLQSYSFLLQLALAGKCSGRAFLKVTLLRSDSENNSLRTGLYLLGECYPRLLQLFYYSHIKFFQFGTLKWPINQVGLIHYQRSILFFIENSFITPLWFVEIFWPPDRLYFCLQA